ncbi:MAG: hypothetical protein HY707_12735 [Ignavibacteriae bacterium]|nr:hypothetical protein [Ignavibacteriota bacterium]
MKTYIQGIQYKYDIITVLKRGKCYFTIKAIHKLSNRSSTINTVNPILSEFDIPVYDKRVAESTWEVSKKRSASLVKLAKELLSDREYLKYLEKILDEDREQSEWENLENLS